MPQNDAEGSDDEPLLPVLVDKKTGWAVLTLS
jgi:hypothetical protein